MCSTASTVADRPRLGLAGRAAARFLADFEVPRVDLVVERDHLFGKLGVLLLERVQRALERSEDELALLLQVCFKAVEVLLEGRASYSATIVSATDRSSGFPNYPNRRPRTSVRLSEGCVKIFEVASYLDEDARSLAFATAGDAEEGGHVRDPRRLLHVVRDDHDRVLLLQLVHQVLDLGGRDRVEG